MQDLKISLISVSLNAEKTIARCIQSVIGQTLKNVEYIVIDGNSTDRTVEIIKEYSNDINIFLSEPDKGIYDAMNKGIKMASGDIIGILNADDFFADRHVLTTIAGVFRRENPSIVYGDLDFIDGKAKTVRKWRSGNYAQGMCNWGWMPPHPTFYCKRSLFNEFGYYRPEYGTAADYELMLRFIHFNNIEPFYIRKLLVYMTTGGASNKSIGNRLKGWRYDLKAMRTNGISFPLLTLIFKPLRKVIQYFI
ncbi:MAG: glycosyltransferase [Mucilaginibacter sp.]|nr:glycosyltransferase [Mucilaginibacter sp.]